MNKPPLIQYAEFPTAEFVRALTPCPYFDNTGKCVVYAGDHLKVIHGRIRDAVLGGTNSAIIYFFKFGGYNNDADDFPDEVIAIAAAFLVDRGYRVFRKATETGGVSRGVIISWGLDTRIGDPE